MNFLELNMQFLRNLAEWRTPLLDTLMAFFTRFGEETVFMVVALTVFWCVDKYKGYFLLTIGFAGTIINQALKITFCIPRPWELDPTFQIVESARAQAAGFSFPSGHTQNAVGTFGGIALFANKTWVKAACILLALVVAFSRLYLGVHTPLDVVVSLVIATLLIFLCYPLIEKMKHQKKFLSSLLLLMLVLSAGYLCYALCVRAAADAGGGNFDAAVKNGWCMLGAVVGMQFAAMVDERYTRFETKAVWWAQILKVVLGLALTVAVKTLLKAPLTALFGPDSMGDSVRYCAMVLAAGVLWPMKFGWFAGLGRKKYLH